MSGSPDQRRLTTAQFEQARTRVSTNATVEAIARAVLVDGRKAIEVAAERKVTRSYVSKIVSRFFQAGHAYETLTVTLPTERAETVRAWHREAMRELTGE